jgi:hypothetical protein
MHLAGGFCVSAALIPTEIRQPENRAVNDGVYPEPGRLMKFGKPTSLLEVTDQCRL